MKIKKRVSRDRIFIVHNGDGINMGVFKTRKKALKFCSDVGDKRYGEVWLIQSMAVDYSGGK